MKPTTSVPSQEAVTRAGFVTSRRQRNPSAASSAAQTTTSLTAS